MKIKLNQRNATIFIIDDEEEIREGLAFLFKSAGLNAETYPSADDFLVNYNPRSCGCIIADLSLPGMSGIDFLENLQRVKNRLPVIVLTGYSTVALAVRAMKAGALDFIAKPFQEKYLLAQIDHAILQSSISVQRYHDLAERLNTLTKREQQVLNLVVKGKLNKQIAEELSIGISTVEMHRARVMHKMQARNLAELIKSYLAAKNNELMH